MKNQLTLPGYYPASYNIHFLGICLTFITACSALKEKSFFQADSLQKQLIRREEKTETKSHLNVLRIYSQEDSSEKRAFTEIIPEGFFRYSSQDGFSGKASRVLVHDHTKRISRVRDSAQFERDKLIVSKTVSKTGETRRLSNKSRLKEKAAHPGNLIGCLAGLLLLFAGMYWLRRRIFN